jgi:hypothetical protein
MLSSAAPVKTNDADKACLKVVWETEQEGFLTMKVKRRIGVWCVLALGVSIVLSGCPPTVVVDVSMAPENAEISVGESVTLVATSTSASDTFTWTSEDDGIASVDAEGEVTGVAIGEVTITAATSTSDLAVTAVVTVVNSAPVATAKIEGLNNVSVGAEVALDASGSDANNDALTYAWSLVSGPEGTLAGFLDPATDAGPGEAVFVPDMEGTYVVQVDVSDGRTKAISSVTQTIHAGTFVGVGIVAKDGSSLTGSSCTGCHNGGFAPDMFTPWQATDHATRFARQLDGEVSTYATENCISCHAVGYNGAGGFAEVQAQLGWEWPVNEDGSSNLVDGNWDDMVANYPDLAALSNIQCENCHGPASQHPAAATQEDNKMSVSLDASVCGECHHENVQWERSFHSKEDDRAFTYPAGEGHEGCVACHSGGGYIDFTNGVPEEERRVEVQAHTCAVCHDPHDATNPHQLRTYDEVMLPGDEAPRTGLGSSATCMVCHNGRRSSVDEGLPHYTLGGAALLGINGETYGVNLGNSAHTALTSCVDCHMAATPGVSAHDGILEPGEDKVGGHTFAVKFVEEGDEDNGFENVVNACVSCHDGLDVLNRTANGDFDGNGTIEGVQDETRGLLTILQAALVSFGAVDVGHYPYWTYGDLEGEALTSAKNAAWNYQYVLEDASFGIHNTRYLIGLAQLSYNDLTGVDVPNADLVYTK